MNVMNNNHPIQSQRGFTLIEIMIALVVFMIIMLGVAAGMIQSIRVNKANAVRDEAVRLATDELNALKALPFTLNDDGLGTTAGWVAQPNMFVNIRAGAIQYSRSRQIANVNATATALKRIDVAVGWDDPGGGPPQAPTNTNRQVSFSTVLVRDDNLL